ncbi:hypothetical protein As57867_018653, partial [Aphanomyces stellatus]
MNINRPKPAKGLTMGTFFGTFGSPIRTSYMDQAAPNGGPTSPQDKAKVQQPVPEPAVVQDADVDEITDDIATVRVDRRASPAPAVAAERKEDYPAEAAVKVPQIQLDVAKKAKIPLFLKSPFYAAAAQKPEPVAAAAPVAVPVAAPAPRAVPVPVGRATLSRHINFAEVSLGR